MFLLLTLNIFQKFSSASIADFEQVYVSWDTTSQHPLDLMTSLIKSVQRQQKIHETRFIQGQQQNH